MLDKRLTGREWLVDEYSIADICTAPWLRAFDIYDVKEALDWGSRPHVEAWLDRFVARPAVARAVNIPPRG